MVEPRRPKSVHVYYVKHNTLHVATCPNSQLIGSPIGSPVILFKNRCQADEYLKKDGKKPRTCRLDCCEPRP